MNHAKRRREIRIRMELKRKKLCVLVVLTRPSNLLQQCHKICSHTPPCMYFYNILIFSRCKQRFYRCTRVVICSNYVNHTFTNSGHESYDSFDTNPYISSIKILINNFLYSYLFLFTLCFQILIIRSPSHLLFPFLHQPLYPN